MNTKALLRSAVLSLAALAPLHAQEAVTDPVGFVNVSVPAQSDAILAVPFYRTPVFKGQIEQIQGSSIILSTNPAWTENQLVQSLPSRLNSHAVLIATGAKEGMLGFISANTANSVTLTLPSGDTLQGVKSNQADGAGQGDEIDVIPYWTYSSIFSSNPLAGSQILLMPTNLAGINFAAAQVTAFNGSNWRRSGNDVNHEPLAFGGAFIFRNNSNSPQNLSLVGTVPMSSHRSIIRTLAASTRQDNWVGYSSPVPENIGSLNFGFATGDQLLVFDNSAVGKNKAASQIITYNGTVWRSGGVTVDNTFFLQPAFGYVFRKAATAQASNFFWQDTQSYLGTPN